MASTDARAGYAPVGDLSMYYEVHSSGGLGLLDRADWLLAMIPPFLDAPMPQGS